jgi:diguanylate cyclase (GGDEF)-like protein
MTSSAADEPPARSANGSIKGLHERAAGTADASPGIRPTADEDATLADADQTWSDRDQTAADGDQTSADTDQAASDSDQAASDEEFAHGGNPSEHERTRDLRERGTKQRQQSAQDRMAAAAARDAVAHARDLRAAARDEAAAVLDRELAALDASRAQDARAMSAAEIVLRAGENRRSAAAARAAAAEARARAAADREQAARDREQAARDRRQAQEDRDALLRQLALAETDALTGARTRGAGLADLEREIERARRSSGMLTVAFVDVVGMKATNDAQGHGAGDALLQRVVVGIRRCVRSYDLIIRLGGDEFLCVMSGAGAEEILARFAAVQATLAADPAPCEIAVGFATLAPEDSPQVLIGRADSDLLANRRSSRGDAGRS